MKIARLTEGSPLGSHDQLVQEPDRSRQYRSVNYETLKISAVIDRHNRLQCGRQRLRPK
jgi:DNA-binding transcriptional MocR family regulator